MSFSALATGAAPISYQWTKEGAAIAGETGTSIALNDLGVGDAGTYRGEATNAGGTTPSNAAALAVFDPPKPNTAEFVGTSAPAQMFAGQSLLVGITIRNTSELTWSGAQGYALGVIEDAAGLFSGGSRVYLADPLAVIPPANGVAQFVGLIQAPAAPGVYSARLRMVEENVEFFGEEAALQVSVVARPNASADWTVYE